MCHLSTTCMHAWMHALRHPSIIHNSSNLRACSVTCPSRGVASCCSSWASSQQPRRQTWEPICGALRLRLSRPEIRSECSKLVVPWHLLGLIGGAKNFRCWLIARSMTCFVVWSFGRLVVWLFGCFMVLLLATKEWHSFISSKSLPQICPTSTFPRLLHAKRSFQSHAPPANTLRLPSLRLAGWLAGCPSRNSGGGSIEKTRRKSFSSRFVAAEREPIRNLYLLKNASKAKGNRKNAKHVYCYFLGRQ